MKRLAALWPIVLLGVWLYPLPAQAQSSPDSGATAWLLTSTALVLLMTLPGLALFYGGLVRSRNVLSVLRGEAKPDTDGRAGRKSLELILGIYESAKTGIAVPLPLKG